ncbi:MULTISPECIES: hypothetical protein [unclassified Mesorhizobium]|uniref:hypothetical protein n=1 Tax=unclassified Mesorhizobium TaxID=325217 RepID=UPI000FD8C5A4|nr:MULTISPECIES: hypothetical protein [unclassified Mesorhizobium]TGR58273.1 hypothetical protein EN842_01385 [bacterium M00.F.Ca.ET.199.01.1.1]TGU41619.1 hypothetical protein EN799_03430 [bacterium M00.F.Ca.ET.156.01.1.1]TGV89757.1 hypothetical protein EN792_006255 [Mesorhizobium sp. M00.F.Ca.ET.149.01.1.1]TGR33015.1 hypothetical protein EN840_01385 [Mesorhizobium sp. M8A.F.Ca.ET.197.01.1.1]TGR34661.1 hypothetical protein EN845_01385 [Mesorhizobium sp. M8A.F.Ca.ET.202.01.1.1]
MTDDSLALKLRPASEDTLTELIRQAEAHLDTQLTAAIAADQRAYTFAGLAAASGIVLIGGAYNLATSSQPNILLASVATAVAATLVGCAWSAVHSARSIEFGYSGSQPSDWDEDVACSKPWAHSLAEKCEHYNDLINANRRAMNANSQLFNSATELALKSLLLGGVAFTAWLVNAFTF